MTCHPYIENDIDPESVKKEPKENVAAFGHAIRDEGTVVIEQLDAAIALFAMDCASWSHNVASETILKLCDVCRLAIKPVKYQIVLELQPPSARVLIVWLSGYQAWVCRGHFVQEVIDEKPEDKANCQGQVVRILLCEVNP